MDDNADEPQRHRCDIVDAHLCCLLRENGGACTAEAPVVDQTD